MDNLRLQNIFQNFITPSILDALKIATDIYQTTRNAQRKAILQNFSSAVLGQTASSEEYLARALAFLELERETSLEHNDFTSLETFNYKEAFFFGIIPFLEKEISSEENLEQIYSNIKHLIKIEEPHAPVDVQEKLSFILNRVHDKIIDKKLTKLEADFSAILAADTYRNFMNYDETYYEPNKHLNFFRTAFFNKSHTDAVPKILTTTCNFLNGLLQSGYLPNDVISPQQHLKTISLVITQALIPSMKHHEPQQLIHSRQLIINLQHLKETLPEYLKRAYFEENFNTNGEYISLPIKTWKKYFDQAISSKEHHFIEFILEKLENLDAEMIPAFIDSNLASICQASSNMIYNSIVPYLSERFFGQIKDEPVSIDRSTTTIHTNISESRVAVIFLSNIFNFSRKIMKRPYSSLNTSSPG